jgi:arylsulfatase
MPSGLTIASESVSQNAQSSWAAPVMQKALAEMMKSFVQYPPRKMQSYGYTGPITISNYKKFEWVREQLEKEGVNIHLPTGN